jgi:HPt (histidine-containing phosphotransfer) domain-containing protein
MSQFLELQDIEALRNSVHALKGSCGALGIQRLFERSRITEEKCRLGELSDLESQIKHIKHDYTESLIAIDKILA